MSKPRHQEPLQAYEALLAKGELKPDPSQRVVAEKLDSLCRAIDAGREKRGFLERLKNGNGRALPKGLYIFGPVGRGKSMLMDLFFRGVPFPEKKRVHFHQFMQDVHGQIHGWRNMTPDEREKELGVRDLEDPIRYLAKKIAGEAKLLCFDEFHVTNVADAMILGRLYQNLFAENVVIVSTSNRAPGDLYKNGINHSLFLPFIDMIGEKMEVVELTGPVDYRFQRIKGLKTYYTPVNEKTTEELRKAFWALTDRDVGDPKTVASAEIEVQGRKLFIPKAARGVAVFSFKRLCVEPLGAADYLAIAWRFHTVIVVAIPKMERDMRNEASRFVTMIDVFYENNVKVFCSADVGPEKLYPAGDGSFEFERTVSRLYEMQSEDYLARGHAV